MTSSSMIDAHSPSGDPDAPSRQHLLTLAGLGAGSVALLATLVARVGADDQWAIDHVVRETLAEHRAPRLRAALRVVERIGTLPVYAPSAALAMRYVARRSSARRALSIGAAVAGAAGLGFLLKLLVCRPRPAGASGPVNSRPSFPSGHTSRATALVAMLAYVATRERLAPREIASACAAIVALGVGASRAYADAHWTTDVIAGWAVGITSMAASAHLYERARWSEHA